MSDPTPDFSPEAIAARWDRSHDHGPDDYTDDGCRVLAAAAFQDIAQLLAALEAERAVHVKVQRLQRAEYRLLKSKARKLAAAEAALEAKDGELARLREALRNILGAPLRAARDIAAAALAPSTPTEGE